MKKLLFAFVIGLALVGGCNEAPVTPASKDIITESDNGKTFSVTKSGKLAFSFKVNQSEDYFWSVSKMDGDFEVATDTRVGERQVIVIQCASGGNLEFTYNKFAPEGAQVLKKVTMKIVLK